MYLNWIPQKHHIHATDKLAHFSWLDWLALAATRFAPGHFKFQAKEERGNLAPNWDWTADEDYFLTMYVGEGGDYNYWDGGRLLLCVALYVY